MDTATPDHLVGQIIDERYRIEALVARGGMATVYRARDQRLEREVALKVMLPELAGDPEFVARFVREARAAARLSHPNVVSVFDQGSDGSMLYLAMEFLSGRTLRDVLAQRKVFTVREALTVMEPLLDALAAAHRAGIVHRDMKPENVILTDDGRVKVADFGLARAAANVANTTANGMVLGTAAYLAPEVLTTGNSDARTDVYAAGIMLFEMVTGTQPFGGRDATEIAHLHVTSQVPAPSTRVPGLPGQIDDLVLESTQPDPGLRPANAVDFLALVRPVRRLLPDQVLDHRPAVGSLNGAASGTPNGAANGAAAPAPLSVAAPSEPPFGQEPAWSGDPSATSMNTEFVPPPPGGFVGQGGEPNRTRAMPMVRRDEKIAPPVRPMRPGRTPNDLMDARRRRGQLALVGALAIAVVLAFTTWWYTGGPGSRTPVPGGLTGATQTAAETKLKAAGLSAKIVLVYDDEAAKGIVISTNPGGGGSVRNGSPVELTVSKGPEMIAVPQLAGLSLDDAKNKLAELKLTLGDTEDSYSDQVEKDQVIATDPVAGTTVKPGTAIKVVLNTQEPVQVPNVGGLYENAKKWLEDQGFEVAGTEQDQPGVASHQVLSQDPAPGTQVGKGSTITLTYAKGDIRQVPDVVGMDPTTARNTLNAAGFQYVSEKGNFFGGNTVRRQEPAAGEYADPATTEIKYWVGW